MHIYILLDLTLVNVVHWMPYNVYYILYRVCSIVYYIHIFIFMNDIVGSTF